VAGRLDRVLVNVADEIVEISRKERDVLLNRLCFVPGSETVRERFEAVSTTRPVVLDAGQRSRLRTALDGWDRDLRPHGITRLHAALIRNDRFNLADRATHRAPSRFRADAFRTPIP
jgi:hypothetical protein